jgi:hypothetical protein
MRPSVGLLGLALLLAPSVLAQDDPPNDLPDLATVSVPDGAATKTDAPAKETSATDRPKDEEDPKTTDDPKATSSIEDFVLTGSAPPASSTQATTSQNAPATSLEVFHLTGLPTIAGVSPPEVTVPDTKAAPYMQKSSLPDGTVFICVGAALGFFGAALLAWRAMVAWSLHRSVKRAALAQNMADMKAMSAVPGKKRGMYNVVGANSTMSLDRLAAAPTGTSRPPKPFASTTTGTPPKSSSSLFFSPTAAGAPRDSVTRSSSYLPAGYYPTGNAQPAQGSPVMHVGGHGAHLSTHSLATPGNRFSHRSGISPPGSPSLPPSSRGYDRPPPSREGLSSYNRASVASRGVYGQDTGNVSQLSLNVPGGTSVAGGRAPSAYLEDLFENHGNGPRERF